ncbi:MAG: ATP-binding protein [Flavobacteriales bacterium]|nr:ATP-binding protein [Flavobacteriales bacterium]
MTPITLDDLRKFKEFDEVPDDQLNWLIEVGEVIELEPNELIFRRGEASDHMTLIMFGKIDVYGYPNESKKYFGSFEANSITGLLPYSRLTHASGDGIAAKPSRIFQVHRDQLKAMIENHYELTASLVHFMTSRVREFSQSRMQNEKLMALGKISAGLAHELNNPASAIVRSSQALKSHLKQVPEGFKQVMEIDITPEITDEVSKLLFTKVDTKPEERLSLRDRNRLEDEIADWLEDHGVEDGFESAENFVEYRFTIDDFEEVAEVVKEKDLPAVINWMYQNLTTDRMVDEIEQASERIASIIKSVKSYSYMDRDQDLQPVDVSEGIESTVTMLNHKIKKGRHEIEIDLGDNVPKVKGLPGELNQVWTNIIDNAIDAMKDKPGHVRIVSFQTEGMLSICIEDNGPGIPDDVKTRIFEPFFTTKAIGEGTGLGLDVVMRIIKKHNGEIVVNSQPGRTRFEVRLPIMN